MNRIRKRLTYANVMSSLAVFLVLGGATAFAATKIGSNEIKANAIITGKIKKEAVTEGKIKAGAVGNSRLGNGVVSANKLAPNAVTGSTLADNSVTSSKLAENSVISGKIANAAVTSAKLANGAVTAAQLGNGAVNAAQLGSITVQTETVSVASGATGSANVVCLPGQRAISGGGAWSAFVPKLEFLSTRPIKSLADVEPMANGEVATGWRASGFNNGSGVTASILVWVMCLN